ncbi:hypothetical protein BsWGS_11447 [Bradybaena similaris]
MVKARAWILQKNFHGFPTMDNFKLVEEDLPELQDGDILIEALFLTVDPYMRGFPNKVGRPLVGEQVARLSAYYGFLEKCRPRRGDVVLVNAAAGAVGNVVGQIAKLKGCTVIGSTSTKEKCDWLKELGFDHVFNYKETSVAEALQKYAPNGVDCYFDNVGGEYTYTVLPLMNRFGRVCVCGQISEYNATTKAPGSGVLISILMKELIVSGLIVYTYTPRYHEAITEMAQWIKKGKLKYEETIRDGFDKLPATFIEIFQSTAKGKLLVKA